MHLTSFEYAATSCRVAASALASLVLSFTSPSTPLRDVSPGTVRPVRSLPVLALTT